MMRVSVRARALLSSLSLPPRMMIAVSGEPAPASVAWNSSAIESTATSTADPEVRRRRIPDKRAQRVRRARELRLGEGHGFLVARDLRLAFDDVERRHRADLDGLPVDVQ